MSIGDAIIILVDKLLSERETVIRLELSDQQSLNNNISLNKD